MLFKQGRIPEGQQVLAMLKEQEYYDYIRGGEDSDDRTTQASYNGIEARADKKLKAQEKVLSTLGQEANALREKQKYSALSATEKERLNTLEAELEQADLAFNQALDEIKTLFSQVEEKTRYAELEKKQLENDLTDVVRHFGDDVALLQYVVLEDQAYIVMTTANNRILKEVSLKKEQMNTAIADFLKVLKDPTLDARAEGQALYQLLIAPVEAELQGIQAKTLMLSLDGALRYIPMAALYDGKQYLAERYALSLYTAASTVRIKDPLNTQWKVAGLGVTQAHAGFNPLPAVEAELANIVKTDNNQGVLPGTVDLDAQFTAAHFKDKLRDRNPVVHIASHFKFDPAGDTESFLLLGDGSKLTLKDIRTHGFSFSGVDLLTLSACQTGIGGVKDTRGREIEGLGVLAQQKGAKGVIATLWSVNDASTGIFMREFYRLKQEQHITKAEAIRQTQVAMMTGQLQARPAEVDSKATQVKSTATKANRGGIVPNKDEVKYQASANAPYAHPYYWAPFILMGNWL